MRTKILVNLVLTCVCILIAGGCNYYAVTDLDNGSVYYTRDVDKLHGGAVRFEDERTGNDVTLQSTRVDKIDKDDFKSRVYGGVEPD